MASSMRKLTPKLVTLSPPPTPKDVYKLLGVSGPAVDSPQTKDVHRLLGISGPTPKDVYKLLGGVVHAWVGQIVTFLHTARAARDF